MDLLHINTFYQYIADYLLNLIMHLFFQIQILQLLIFCIDDLEYMTTSNQMLCLVFISIITKVNHLYLLGISLLFTLRAFVPYAYVLLLSNFCNLLSSLLLSAIWLNYSVYTQCGSLLNLCCKFSMVSFLNRQYVWELNLSILFLHIFCSFSFLNILIIIF